MGGFFTANLAKTDHRASERGTAPFDHSNVVSPLNVTV